MSVQLENGYLKLANEILEILAKTPLNGTQRRIIDVLFRYTYGFNRKEHALSETFISKATEIDKRQIRRELKKLIEAKVILVSKAATFTESRTLKFNKNYKQWEITKQTTEGKIDHSPEGEKNHSPGGEIVPQEIKTKNTIKKDIRPKNIYPDDSLEMELSKLLFDMIKANNPKFKEPRLQTWCKNIELMLRLDKRDAEDIRQVIIFAQSDNFWKSNILSTKSLREQFDRLYMQSLSRNNAKSSKNQNVYDEVMKNLQNKQKEMSI